MRSLVLIQNPELAEGLGGPIYTPPPLSLTTPGIEDPSLTGRMNVATIGIPEQVFLPPPSGAVGPAATPVAAPATPAAPATMTPQEALDFSRQYAFISSLHRGQDYGMRSNERNAFYLRDSGLGFDLFGTIVQSVQKSAPEAFKGVKGSTLLPNFGGPSGKSPLSGITLPSWVPRIAVPKPIQGAIKKVATQAVADVKKARAQSPSGVAAQTQDFVPVVGHGANWLMFGFVAAGVVSVGIYASRRKRGKRK